MEASARTRSASAKENFAVSGRTREFGRWATGILDWLIFQYAGKDAPKEPLKGGESVLGAPGKCAKTTSCYPSFRSGISLVRLSHVRTWSWLCASSTESSALSDRSSFADFCADSLPVRPVSRLTLPASAPPVLNTSPTKPVHDLPTATALFGT